MGIAERGKTDHGTTWLDFYVHPSSVLGRGTQGGWAPWMAQSEGRLSVDGSACCYFPVCFWILKCPVLFLKTLFIRKKQEWKRTLPFLSNVWGEWALSLAGAVAGPQTASGIKKCNIIKRGGIFLRIRKSCIFTVMIVLEIYFSSVNSLIWIFIQIIILVYKSTCQAAPKGRGFVWSYHIRNLLL